MSRIKVTVERIDGCCSLPVLVGDHFFVEDSKLTVPDGRHVCIWALSAMMPVFPILEQRTSLPTDHWVTRVERFQCPDPDGRVIYRLELVGDD